MTSLPFTLVDSTVTGSLEFYDQTAHTATVVSSIVRTADPGFLVLYGRSGSTFRVLNSIVDGGAYGNLKCVNVVTSALDPLSGTCQPQ